MSLISGVGGPAVGGGLRFGQMTRGRIQGSTHGVNYPSPFFDVAHTYLPNTVKQLFRWCRYYFLTNPLINAIAYKLSEYPVTDIIVDHDSPKVRAVWTEYLQDHLKYRGFQIEAGLDYHVYGNAMIGMGFPFKKFLKCGGCDFKEIANKIRAHWVFTNNAFRLTCPKCGRTGDAVASDFYYKNASGIKLIRWNPEDVEVTYNDITGDYTYYYSIPSIIRNDIVIGRKEIIEGVPQIFIQAIRESKGIIFSKDNFFHLRRPTLATQDRGWGIPLLLPVLKDTFYLQLMKKAQEAILLEHIVPLRILFPQAGSGTADPYTSINLVDWREHVATEIARWRLDNNYIPIMPLPLGNQTIGGDGRSLLLTQEIQIWSEQIINGMQVPIEFVKGGMSYAGTNVSMRMLENQFIGYILRQKALLRFVIKQVAAFMGWPEVNVRFKPFKMADDLQRKAFDFQLNQMGKLSDTTLLAGSDYSAEDENAIMLKETDSRLEATKKQQIATAQVQGEAQLVMAKFQVKAQQLAQQAQMAPAAPGEPGGPEAGGMGGTPGGQPGEPVALPPELQIQGIDGQPLQGQRPQVGPSPGDFLASVGSQLSAGQKMPTTNGVQSSLNVDLPTLAMQQAQQLAAMPPDQQKLALDNLKAQSPELADLVAQYLKQMGGAQNGASKGPQVDMRPLPNKLPPRRTAQLV
jgi:hypothetical protein